MSDPKHPGDGSTSGLLGDLESIRSLLGEQDASDSEAEHDRSPDESSEREHGDPREQHERGDRYAEHEPSHPVSADEDVPLLEDVVHGGVSVNEGLLPDPGGLEEGGTGSLLDEEIFKALLSDEWRDSAREMLDQARAAIARHQTEWTPEHTDELNQALKVRIDETLQHWLREVVQTRIHELRQKLLDAVSEQIRITIDEQFDPQATHEDPDGE